MGRPAGTRVGGRAVVNQVPGIAVGPSRRYLALAVCTLIKTTRDKGSRCQEGSRGGDPRSVDLIQFTPHPMTERMHWEEPDPAAVDPVDTPASRQSSAVV
jgi:hypothetical protein